MIKKDNIIFRLVTFNELQIRNDVVLLENANQGRYNYDLYLADNEYLAIRRGYANSI